MRWAVETAAACKMGHREFHVLIALLTFRNRKTGTAWPSAGTLAELTGMSVSAVERALRTLRTLAVIEQAGRRKASGGLSTIEYRFVTPSQHQAEVPASSVQHQAEVPASEVQAEVPAPSVQVQAEVPGAGVQVQAEVPASGEPGPGTSAVQVQAEVTDKPLERTSREVSSSRWEYEGAWLGLVWRPRREAMDHAIATYPGVDYYAVTVSYLEYSLGAGKDPKNGYWLDRVKQQHERQASKTDGFTDAEWEAANWQREVEAALRYYPSRGLPLPDKYKQEGITTT